MQAFQSCFLKLNSGNIKIQDLYLYSFSEQDFLLSRLQK